MTHLLEKFEKLLYIRTTLRFFEKLRLLLTLCSGLISQPASQQVSHPASQPLSQPASQSASQPASQPVSQSSSQPASQPTSQPANQSASQPVRQSDSQSVSQSVSQSDSRLVKQGGNHEARKQTSGQTGCFYEQSYLLNKLKLRCLILSQLTTYHRWSLFHIGRL